MKKRLLIFLYIVAILFIPGFSLAAGDGLTISPPIVDIDAKSGQTFNHKIKLTNPTKKLIEVYPTVMNFRSSGEGGEPSFYPVTEEEKNFSLGHWIKFQQTKVALLPEQVVEFEYSILVPEGSEPGGHYGVIFFATEPPTSAQQGNNITISSMIGALIMVRVDGSVIEKGFLEEFKSNKVYFKLPASLNFKVANLGNIHFKPKGDITIRSMGQTEVAKIKVNDGGGSVLPDSVRKFDVQFSKNRFALGLYHAKLALTYGETERTLEGQQSFWVLPIWFLASIGLAILLIIIIIFLRKKKRKRS